MPSRFPSNCVPEDFSKYVNIRTEIYNGGIVYRHELFEQFQVDVLGQKPGTKIHRECPTMFHHLTRVLLNDQLKFHNCNNTMYNDEPSAFLAV